MRFGSKETSQARPYRRGIRFADGTGDGGGGGHELNLDDPAVKAAIEKAVEDKRSEYDEGMKRLQTLAKAYGEEAEYRNTDWYRQAKQLQDSGKPVRVGDQPARPQGAAPATDPEEYFSRRVQALQDDFGFDAAQAKGVMALLREQGADLVKTFRREVSVLQNEHKEALSKVSGDLDAYRNDPDRLFRDALQANEKITKDVSFEDAPEDVRERARELMKEYDTTPQIATLMAFGEKGAKPYIDHQKEEKERAERAEMTPAVGGGLRGEGLPLPADLENAGLEEFMAMANDQKR